MNRLAISRDTASWMAVALFLAGAAIAPAGAQTFAELRTDYDAHAPVGGQPSTGLMVDTIGDGVWNFFSSATENPSDGGANLTALTYEDTTAPHAVVQVPAYLAAGQSLGLPGINNIGLILPVQHNGVPNADELALHPGQGGQPNTFLVIRWTAGASSAGTVDITGAFRGNAASDKDWRIFVNGVLEFSENSGTAAPGTFPQTAPFLLEDVTIAAGQHVDLVIGLGSGDDFSGDHSFLSAKITEPTFPPAAPSDLSATAIGPNQVDLMWTDNSDNEDNFVVDRRISGGPDSFAEVASPSADSTTHSDLTVALGTTYEYRVRAVNNAGEGSSEVALVTTTGTRPPAKALAQLQLDYDAHTPIDGQPSRALIPDTIGDGGWNFFSSATENPSNGGANLTALTFEATDKPHAVTEVPAYVSLAQSIGLPGINNFGLIVPVEHNGVPNADELALHPGQDGQPNTFMVVRWTAGASSAGLIDITGAFRGNAASDKDWRIFVNGILVFSENSGTTAPPDFPQTAPFLLKANVAAGQHVDFVIGSGADNDFSADHSFLSVTITQEPAIVLNVNSSGDDLVFTWNSRPGKVYDLRSETGLSSDPANWPIWDGHEGIESTPDENMLTIPRPVDAARYFVIGERDAPPVFSDNFESGQGAWATASDGDAGTDWELGTPSVIGPVPPGTPLPSSTNCFGTNLDSNYAANADVTLTSEAILLPDGGSAPSATLCFQQWINIDNVRLFGNDVGSVEILDADNSDALLEIIVADVLNTTGWEKATIDLTTYLGANIKIRFRLASDNDFFDLEGWYIDDVEVTVP